MLSKCWYATTELQMKIKNNVKTPCYKRVFMGILFQTGVTRVQLENFSGNFIQQPNQRQYISCVNYFLLRCLCEWLHKAALDPNDSSMQVNITISILASLGKIWSLVLTTSGSVQNIGCWIEYSSNLSSPQWTPNLSCQLSNEFTRDYDRILLCAPLLYFIFTDLWEKCSTLTPFLGPLEP